MTRKAFSAADYCFAVESFPNCSYEQLRDFLVLSSKRKFQSSVSSVNINEVLNKTLQKVDNDQQKNAFLLIDEVKIRPTVAFSGGVLNGLAKNDPDSKTTSMLWVMLKCLHGGPSVMISITPVHRLTSKYQFGVVKEAAVLVEKSGGVVIGSITDNHRINQQFCKLFDRSHDFLAIHPLDATRSWYLLLDTVHLLKCIRNNWLSEKCQMLSLDKKPVARFSDVKDVYKEEKDQILKNPQWAFSSACPSKLQLHNVQHVLNVFKDSVIAALRLQACELTSFIQFILDWWNTVNVSAKGQNIRLNDSSRHVQDQNSNNLQVFLEKF